MHTIYLDKQAKTDVIISRTDPPIWRGGEYVYTAIYIAVPGYLLSQFFESLSTSRTE